MDVRVEARPLTAGAEAVEVQLTVETVTHAVIASPVVSRFTLAPVISVGGNSISAVNPEFNLTGDKALAFA